MTNRTEIVDLIKRDVSDRIERQHVVHGMVDGANEAEQMSDAEAVRRWIELRDHMLQQFDDNETDRLAYDEGRVRAFETDLALRFARRIG